MISPRILPIVATAVIGCSTLCMSGVASAQNDVMPAASAAKIDAKARAVLRKMSATYKAANTYSGDISMKLNGLGTSEAVNAKIAFERQAKFSVDATNATGKLRIVSDGGALHYSVSRVPRSYIKANAPVTKDALRWMFSEIGAGGPALLTVLTDTDPLEIYGTSLKSVSLGTADDAPGAPVDSDIVIVQFVERKNSGKVVYAIGKSNGVLHSVRATQIRDGKEFTSVETHSNVQINPELKPETFRFNTVGLQQIDEFPKSPWSPRLKIGGEPLPIPLADTEGKLVDFADYKGKVLLLDFWASWCDPCGEDAPEVLAAYQQFKGDGFEIIGICMDVEREAMQAFMETHKMDWRQVFDGNAWESPTFRTYVETGTRGIPFTVVIGRDGKVAAIGARGDRLNQAIERAIYNERTIPNEDDKEGLKRMTVRR